MFNFTKNIFNKKEEKIPEELENVAQYAGFKLAFYLNACNLTQEEKIKIFKLIENKTYQQILEIIDRFDSLYAEGKTKELNQEFENEVKKIVEKTNQDRKDLEDRTVTKIKELFTEVKTATQDKK